MFLKNCWYAGGWSDSVSQGKHALITREIAGESVVLYRQASGKLVALDDRCCHRQAPLSLGRKEGDNLRCMYHGWKFDPTGACIEIPGQAKVVQKDARVHSYPVVEKNDLIWIWMGDPELADESLICNSVGPNNPAWDMRTAHLLVHTNYRLEIANLNDLTHAAWVHANTFGGTTAYANVRAKQTITPRGVNTEFWLRSAPGPVFAQHLFPEGMLFDMHWMVEFTVPCNFMLHFRAYTAGKNTEGQSDGQLVLDTFTSQAITPRDEDSVDYYYSWGVVKGSTAPGIVEMMIESNHEAFLEDKMFLEGQHKRMKAKPGYKMVDYAHDAGPGKMFFVLDKLIKEEAEAAAAKAAQAAPQEADAKEAKPKAAKAKAAAA